MVHEYVHADKPDQLKKTVHVDFTKTSYFTVTLIHKNIPIAIHNSVGRIFISF